MINTELHMSELWQDVSCSVLNKKELEIKPLTLQPTTVPLATTSWATAAHTAGQSDGVGVPGAWTLYVSYKYQQGKFLNVILIFRISEMLNTTKILQEPHFKINTSTWMF